MCKFFFWHKNIVWSSACSSVKTALFRAIRADGVMPTRTITRRIPGPLRVRSPSASILLWNKWQRRAIYLIDPFAYVSVSARRRQVPSEMDLRGFRTNRIRGYRTVYVELLIHFCRAFWSFSNVIRPWIEILSERVRIPFPVLDLQPSYFT